MAPGVKAFPARHLPGIIDGLGAGIRPAEGAEVVHHAVAAGRAVVAEGMAAGSEGVVPPPRDLPRVVDGGADAVGAEGVQIAHDAAAAGHAVVAEGVRVEAASKVAGPRDLPSVVDARASAVRPAEEGAKVVDGGRRLAPVQRLETAAPPQRRRSNDSDDGNHGVSYLLQVSLAAATRAVPASQRFRVAVVARANCR